MTVSTKNFNIQTDPKLACTCLHVNCDERTVQQWVLDKVQLMRDDASRPLIITSGGRCIYHPDELDRVNEGRTGDHQDCIVVDIAYKTMAEASEIAALAGRHGATAVAIGNGFVHCAWRKLPDGDNRIRTWSY